MASRDDLPLNIVDHVRCRTIYTYDSFGRRTTKTINGFTTKYLHDGLNVVQEKNGTGGITANVLTGLGIDELLTRTDSVGARGFLTDALGTTIALVDNAGVVQTEYKYEPYGSVNRTGQASQNAFKYTGREDDGTGLYYYRARYYHPRLQRFISEDPLKFRGGDVVFYAYVANNPLAFIDPTGLLTSPEALAHYVGGSGTSISIPFSDIDTSRVGANTFAAVRSTITSCKPGTFTVKDETGFSTGIDAAAYLGSITLRLNGTITVNCDCSWCFGGALFAAPDKYDFDPKVGTHRSLLGEASTVLGSYLPGKPYLINILGSRYMYQCSN